MRRTSRREGGEGIADYVTIGGVRTWFDERGDCERVVLLQRWLQRLPGLKGNLDGGNDLRDAYAEAEART